MTEKETRNSALRDKDGNEIGVFTGKQPGRPLEGREQGAMPISS
jgi:hypothetical protein